MKNVDFEVKPTDDGSWTLSSSCTFSVVGIDVVAAVLGNIVLGVGVVLKSSVVVVVDFVVVDVVVVVVVVVDWDTGSALPANPTIS